MKETDLEKRVTVGGQAVIEGVMMRSPENVCVAVRKPDGTIHVKREPFISVTKKIKILGWPIVRGAVVLIESMVLGIKALSYSSEIAMVEESNNQKEIPKKQNSLWLKLSLIGTIIIAFGMGLLLFFYLPLILTEFMKVESGFWFNVIDGTIRMVIFLLYLFLISLLKDIKRIFAYHGAEHKSIYTFEKKMSLTIENARTFTTLHPRCGTSFLLIVMIVSVAVFIFLGKPESVSDRLLRLALVPFIAGISYEFIRLSEKGMTSPVLKWFILPGLWLQKVTTQEPDDSQLEVGIVALRSSLNMDLSDCPSAITYEGQP